ncbi:hypothetical protein D9758_000003 [Tetrapyrgos nigripes]|uniref:Proteasome maturation factor UMP1 n=1 Tax=Tetrapyrgos nigripes TaxID=182062 RepID=A0A8H5BCV5_9AGAR|nr:hypothetical protein D9758_018446 [Tetrapyrgos nigripes]KAF5375210.1 hypothetical protein D9758_000003 [Tetrapyrgos nigripes]
MSLTIVPPTQPNAAALKHTNSLGLHDTLEHGPSTIASQPSGALRNRVENWEETQDNLKLTMMRNVHGLHAPMRLLMERKMVSASPHMPVLPQSNIHLDILMGRDETVEAADVFAGPISGPPLDIHKDMERKLRM